MATRLWGEETYHSKPFSSWVHAMKLKEYKGDIPKEQRILLQDGSLFLMPAGYQDTHLHKIPKHDRECKWRISLTFRSFK